MDSVGGGGTRGSSKFVSGCDSRQNRVTQNDLDRLMTSLMASLARGQGPVWVLSAANIGFCVASFPWSTCFIFRVHNGGKKGGAAVFLLLLSVLL